MSKTYQRLQSLDRQGEAQPVGPEGGVFPAREQAVRRPEGGGLKRVYVVVLALVVVTIGVALALPYILPTSPAIRVLPKRKEGAGGALRRRTLKPDAAAPAGRATVVEARTPAAERGPARRKPAEADGEDAFLVGVTVPAGTGDASVALVGSARAPTTERAVRATVRVGMPDPSAGVGLRRSGPGGAGAEGAQKTEAPVTNFSRAVSLQEAGQWAEAIKYYDKVLLDDPAHAATHCNLGIIHQKLQSYGKAVKEYTAAIAAEPRNYRGYNNLGACYIAQGLYNKAVEALRQSLKLAPYNYSSLCNMGVAQTGLRNFDSAERYLMKAIALAPERFRAVYNLANTYRHAKAPRKARHFYRRFLEKANGRFPDQEKRARRFLKSLGAED